MPQERISLGSLHTGAGVTVISRGGSVLSAAGSGMNITAGANSSLQAFNGVVGTQAAPITARVSAGTLGIHATAARFGTSAFLNGTVLLGQAFTMLNAPPGLICIMHAGSARFPHPTWRPQSHGIWATHPTPCGTAFSRPICRKTWSMELLWTCSSTKTALRARSLLAPRPAPAHQTLQSSRYPPARKTQRRIDR